MTLRPRRFVLLCGLLPAFIIAVLSLYRPSFLANLEYGAYDELVRAERTRPPGGRVAIVDVDERSLSALGQWPWRRDLIGGLIAHIRDLGASSIALDIVFAEADFLRRLMPLLVRHGMLSFSSADVMRYFGRRINQSGDIPAGFNGTLETDLKRRQPGERDERQLRQAAHCRTRGSETTINDVRDFRVYRAKEGGPEEDLRWRPLRKGIADLHRRAEVSQKANERLLHALASVDDSRSVEELTSGIQKPVLWSGRKVRGLRPWADDKELFTAINHGDFLINGFRNRDLQKLLYTTEAGSLADRRRRSSAISRKLRLLRAHGLIQKVSRTHRYHVSETGRAILVAVLTAARTSVNQLNQLPKAA